MKIAIPYQDGQVDQHFGHAEQFRIYDIEGTNATPVDSINTAGVNHGDLAALLKENGVAVVICGGIGDGARSAVMNAGLALCSGVSGDIDEVAVSYANGDLEYGDNATCDHHHDHDHAEEGCGGGCGGGCCGSSCGGGCGGGDFHFSDYVETRTFEDIVTLTVDNFQKEVMDDPGLICIDFWATWCEPCKMMAPIFEACNKAQPKVKFCKVDVDEQSQLASVFGIESVPTVVLVQDRRILNGLIGVQDEESLNLLISMYAR